MGVNCHAIFISKLGESKLSRRCLSLDDIMEIPSKESRATYEQLKSLMLARRSIRDFRDKEVEREVIDKIINAASTSPMGLPPSDVEILVLDGLEAV